jgi:hypothetical protein
MNYIISESQTNQLKTSVFQKLIDSKLEYIKSTCESQDSEEYIEEQFCLESEVIEKIEVQTVSKEKRKNDSVVIIGIKIYFDYIIEYYDFEDFGYFLRGLVANSIAGIPLIINVNEVQNIRTSFDW